MYTEEIKNVKSGEVRKKERKKIGQMGAAVWDFVRTSQQWCVKTADGEMFGDDDVPVFNTQG